MIEIEDIVRFVRKRFPKSAEDREYLKRMADEFCKRHGGYTYPPLWRLNYTLVSVLAENSIGGSDTSPEMLLENINNVGWLTALQEAVVSVWNLAFVGRIDDYPVCERIVNCIRSHLETKEVPYLLSASQANILQVIWCHYMIDTAMQFMHDQPRSFLLSKVLCIKALAQHQKDCLDSTILLRACIEKETQDE